MTYSITYQECIDYWNEKQVYFNGSCIYGIVADAHYEINPYIQHKDSSFSFSFNTPTLIYKYTYMFFKKIPSQDEFSRYYKDFLSYLKLSDINKDF